jgi:hypothetical protein
MHAGSLQGGRVHTDEVEAAHRAFMIERLRIPAQVSLLLRLGCSIVHVAARQASACQPALLRWLWTSVGGVIDTLEGRSNVS